MTGSFSTVKNAAMISLQDIPIVETDIWRDWMIDTCRNDGGRAVSLFAGTPGMLFGVIGMDARGELRVAATRIEGAEYPSLTPKLPEVHLFEREIFEEGGIHPQGHPWLKPVRKIADYPFFRMEGEDIHEVAVGPVHTGIIEPGHFRFQCHGEKVFHLEIQLGFQHRGVEPLLVTADPERRAVLAESIAGDTVIGHGLAHAHAMEGLCGQGIPQRAKGIRAIALELERLANHVGDLGALSGDVGFLTAAAWFGRLRGDFLNLQMNLTGNRYGRGLIRPGGVLADLTEKMAADFGRRIADAFSDLSDVSDLFFSSGMVVARLEQTGVVPADIAQSLGLVGPAARASNLGRDVRNDYPTGAYRFHYVAPVRLNSGDVYARARIRALECKGAIDFILEQLRLLVPEKTFQDCGDPRPNALIVSLVEGWRGEIAHVVMTNDRGEITRYKVVDPSFHNWMALAIAMRDGQISDFPLCNKSFNLSYAGHDL